MALEANWQWKYGQAKNEKIMVRVKSNFAKESDPLALSTCIIHWVSKDKIFFQIFQYCSFHLRTYWIDATHVNKTFWYKEMRANPNYFNSSFKAMHRRPQ